MPAAISTETTPASRLARAPKITRVSTSRPFSSVPIQCASDGALRIAVHEVAIGSYGAISGAKIATADEQHDHHKAGDGDGTMQETPQRKLRRTARHRGGADDGGGGDGGAHGAAPSPQPPPARGGGVFGCSRILPLPLREGVGGRGPHRILKPPSASD